MVQALQTLWKQASPRQPQRVQSDDGTEFMNAKVQAFFKHHQVDHFSTQGDTKAALAEVLIKTLKTKLYRYFTAANTLTYLKALPLIVEQYNHTIHSSIQEKPVHVTPDNEYLIWKPLYKKRLRKRASPKLRVGDVQLNKKHWVFDKGYLPGWTDEVFLVQGIASTPECENIEALNEVREELQQVLQEFQVAHEAYHGLIKTESEQEGSSRYYNSVLEIVSELEQEITSWLNKPALQTSVTPINVQPRDSVSTVGSRVPSPAVQPAKRLRRTRERQHLRLGQLPFKTCTSFKSKK